MMRAALSLGFLLVLAAPAHAATYCVGTPTNCPAAATSVEHFSDAVAAVNAIPAQTNTILVGPGTYTATTGGSHQVTDPGVTIIGSGPGSTIIKGSMEEAPLFVPAVDAVVQDMTFEPVFAQGLGVMITQGILRDVEVRELIGTQAGIRLEGTSVLEGAVVREKTGTTTLTTGVQADPGSSVTVRDLDAAASTPLRAIGTTLTLERARLAGRVRGLEILTGDATVDSALLQVAGGGTYGVLLGDPANTGSMSVVLRGLTVVRENSTSDGLNVSGGKNGAGTDLTVEDSVIRGFPVGLRVPPQPAGGGGVTVALIRTQLAGGIQGVDPTLTSPIDPALDPRLRPDFRLGAGSPLIDAGGPASTQRDADGVTRDADGDGDGIARRDVGAFEYVRRPPTLSASAASPTVRALTPLAFTATAADPDDEAVTVTWDFGDGATATGPSVSHTYLTAGPRTVVVTAVDASGESASVTIPVTVLEPDVAVPDGSGQPDNNVVPPPVPPAVKPESHTLEPRSTRRGGRRRLTVAGTLELPASAVANACTGVPVTLTVSHSGRRVARKTGKLSAACRYRLTVNLPKRLRGKRVSVLATTKATAALRATRKRSRVRVAR